MFKITVKDWRKIPVDNLKFILNQGESKLKHTLDTSDKITNRFYSTLVVLVGLFTAGMGYFNTKYSSFCVYNHKYIINMTFLIIMLIIIFIFLKHISPRKFAYIGRTPHEYENLIKIEPSSELTEEYLYKAILINEIDNIEKKLDYNTRQNQSRLMTLKRLIYIIIVLSGLYFTVYQLYSL